MYFAPPNLKTWLRAWCGNAVPTRSRPTIALVVSHEGIRSS